MQEQLDRAYNLIKAGDKHAAIDILEPLIRENRDNDDAWWLLANATDDITVKRNALNNVLRIGTTEVREAKAHQMLDALDTMPTVVDESDKFSLDSVQSARQQAPKAAKNDDDLPYHGRPVAGERRSGGGCAGVAKIIAIVVAGFGLCMCAAVCAISFTLGETIGDIVELPATANQLGAIEYGEVVDNNLVEGEIDAFTYEAEAGETITIRTRSLSNTTSETNFSPIIIVYGPDNVALPTFNYTASTENNLTITFENAGEYIITARSIMGAGLGDYTLELVQR